MISTTRPQATMFLTRLTLENTSPRQWSDHHAMHNTVMNVFSGIAGDSKRQQGNILYRTVFTSENPHLLIQSTMQPTNIPSDSAIITIPENAWHLPTGTLVVGQATYQPIARNRNNRKVTVRSMEESKEWACNKMTAAALTEMTVIDHQRHRTNARSRNPQHPETTIHVDNITFIATIANSEEFEEFRLRGLGRGKNYGCGLITAIPS